MEAGETPAPQSKTPKMRVLAFLAGKTPAAAVDGQAREMGPCEELLDLPNSTSEVTVVRRVRLPELRSTVQSRTPHLVYIYSSFTGDDNEIQCAQLKTLGCLHEEGQSSEEACSDLVAALAAPQARPDTVFLDFAESEALGRRLHAAGVPHVLAWRDSSSSGSSNSGNSDGRAPVAPCALAALHFAHCFFGALGSPSTTVPEAYALAARIATAHLTHPAPDGSLLEPALPLLLSTTAPVVPGSASIPPPELGPDVDVSRGLAAAFPGYEHIRMLAPAAELRLLLCGLPGTLNPTSLARLGEALRGWLAAELRGSTLRRQEACERPPAHLPPGSAAARCWVASASGASVAITLAAPPALLANAAVLQHALRQTLVADACSLQFKLPPPGVALPGVKVAAAVAGGAPVVEALAVTSVWTVQLLKALAQDRAFRGLVTLGIGAVSSAPAQAFTKQDAARLTTVLTNNDATRVLAPPGIPMPKVPDHLLAAAPPPLGGDPALGPAAASVAPAAAAAAETGVAGGGAATAFPPHPAAPAAAVGAAEADGGMANGTLPALVARTEAVGAAPAGGGGQPAPAAQPSSSSVGAVQAGEIPSSASREQTPAEPGGSSTLAAAAAAAAAMAAAGRVSATAAAPPDGGVPMLLPTASGALAPAAPGAAAAAAPAAAPSAAVNPFGPVRVPVAPALAGVVPWVTSRPPLSQCSEEQFYADLIAFLTDRQGRQIDPKSFPEAVLNGSRLDLYHLYREVCSRGGYKVGNGINWKGQVFPRMRNYTAQHKMTGVGNALKRHYQLFLLEYEQAHPQDITGDICVLCGRGDEVGTDWISCDMCESWQHISCDKRPYLGSFKDYSKGKGRVYHCVTCTEIKRQRAMQEHAVAQAMQAAVAAQVAAAQAAVAVAPPAAMQQVQTQQVQQHQQLQQQPSADEAVPMQQG